jgi:hypothetical protein
MLGRRMCLRRSVGLLRRRGDGVRLVLFFGGFGSKVFWMDDGGRDACILLDQSREFVLNMVVWAMDWATPPGESLDTAIGLRTHPGND